MRRDDKGIVWNSPGVSKSLAGKRGRGLLKADLLIVLGIGALGLLLMAPLIAGVRAAEYDEAIFLDVARNIQRVGLPIRSLGANGVLFLDHTPLYLYLLSLYARHTDSGLLLARSFTVLAALAAVALTYRFGVRVNGRRTGALAALLLAINPFFLVYAFFVRMEVFMLLALLAGLYLVATGAEEDRNGRLLGAGIAFAVAVLFKEFALVGSAVAAAYVAWQRRRTLKHACGGALLVAAPSLAALAGWAAWSWKLSPITFAATMNRWFNSAVSPVAAEPRMGLSWATWAAQLGSQLLGPGLVIGLGLALGHWVVKRGRVHRGINLLLAYSLVAIGLSFVTSLKEPRHLIGVLPAAALLTGNVLVCMWDDRRTAPGHLPGEVSRVLASRAGVLGAAAVIAAVFILAGPIRPPLLPRSSAGAMPLVAPPYAERLAGDRFYDVLALTGARVGSLTAPGEVVTVVHQAPVVGYYADRPYRMLYTAKLPRAIEVLSNTDVLVWDASVFPLLTDVEIARVRAAVDADFSLEEVVSDDHRSAAIYRRKVKP